MPESVRWHDGRVWFADWTAGAVHAVTPDGRDEVVWRHRSLPLCFDTHGEGPTLVVSNATSAVLRADDDGVLRPWTDLTGLAAGAWNEVVLTGPGTGYVNCGNFDPTHGFPDPAEEDGLVVHLGVDATPRVVARGLLFPNGMAVTPDGATLVVAESHAARLTAFDIAPDGSLGPARVWAAVPGHAPDGIAMASDGSCWFADVPNACVVLVGEGGEVQRRVDLGRAAFSCALDDAGTTLYAALATWPADGSFSDPSHVWDGALVALDLGG
jgi:sugar lactone lactonase YvrE